MKKVISALLSVILVFSLCSCIKNDSDTTTEPKKPEAKATEVGKVIYPKSIAFDDYDANQECRDGNALADGFLDKHNDFAYQIASEIVGKGSKNTNISPVSLYCALALAATGAGTDTQQQLLTLLGTDSASELSENCAKLYRLLYSDNDITKLKIANSLWLDEDVSFKDDYIKNASENFYASSWKVNFSSGTAGEAIGKWISENTNGSLSPVIDITPEQIMSIVNTVYFKDQWTDKFYESETAQGVFHTSDGDVQADFMNRTYISAAFKRGEGFTSSSLGLKSGASMTFVLPDEGIEISNLTATPEKLKTLFDNDNRTSGEVVWKIPKFSYDCEYALADTLKKLGVTAAFSEGADFTNITDSQAFISNIVQGTHIAVDENGVEASAFTDISYAGTAMPVGRAEMILDRPFIYAITALNGAILFIGVCNNPA